MAEVLLATREHCQSLNAARITSHQSVSPNGFERMIGQKESFGRKTATAATLTAIQLCEIQYSGASSPNDESISLIHSFFGANCGTAHARAPSQLGPRRSGGDFAMEMAHFIAERESIPLPLFSFPLSSRFHQPRVRLRPRAPRMCPPQIERFEFGHDRCSPR